MRSLDLAWNETEILRDWRNSSDRVRAVERVLSSDLSGTYAFGSRSKVVQ